MLNILSKFEELNQIAPPRSLAALFMNPELFIIITFFLIMTVLGIPMSLYKIFILEEKYGFNKMTIGLFIRDFLISLMLSLLIISILFLSFLFLYSNFEKNCF